MGAIEGCSWDAVRAPWAHVGLEPIEGVLRRGNLRTLESRGADRWRPYIGDGKSAGKKTSAK